jgi:alcohol dehydrogenase
MKKAKAAIFDAGPGTIELQSVELPQPQGQEIRVRNAYTTLCSSDLKTYNGDRKEANPTILGHEVCGTIDAFGPNAPRKDESGQIIEHGDLVTWAVFVSPKDDPQSEAGRPQKAKGLFKYGHERHTSACSWHGGLAEYTILRPDSLVLKVKKEVPLPVTALANCAVATMAGALRVAEGLTGRHVLVSGGGTLGLVGCALCKAAGAASITVAEPNEHRRAMAREFGADKVFAPEQLSGAFDLIFETSGMPSSMENTLESLAIGGKAIWVGAVFPQRKLNLSAEQLIRRLHTIKGLHNYNRTDFINAVGFLEQFHSQFPFEKLIQREFPLSEVRQAFEYAISEKPFRAGVRI